MSRSAKAIRPARVAALGVLVAACALGGCSDIYFERRETVASGAGDAVASNIAVQTIDPWPPNVGNRNIPMNGDRAVLAAQRYRANRVVPLHGASTGSGGNEQQQAAPQGSAAGGMTAR